jgi:mono/diheme cytochrome c family protein
MRQAAWLLLLLAAPIAVAVLVGGEGHAAQDTDAGIYSEAQAARGEQLYQQYCVSCHGGRLQGNPAAPLAGPTFVSRWADGAHTLDDLLYIMRTQMPYNAPASLSKQQYADVLAYVLKVNGYPAGEAELAPVASVLKGVTLRPR